jgi:hypothetical protein
VAAQHRVRVVSVTENCCQYKSGSLRQL